MYRCCAFLFLLGISATFAQVTKQVPYQVFLNFTLNDNTSRICEGSLITKNYVLTSGTCVFNAVSAVATFGAYKPLENEPNQVKINSKSIRQHNRQDSTTLIHNIALIHLEKSAEFNEYIQTVKIPSNDNETYDNQTAIASGWPFKYNILYPHLAVLENTIMPNTRCEYYIQYTRPEDLCLSHFNDTKVCFGGHGGPLVIDNILVGINAFEKSFCAPGYPQKYVRVSKYIDWILDNTDLELN